MNVNSPNKSFTRKRPLNNPNMPNAKRMRQNKTIRFSNALTNVKTINRVGKGAPVNHATSTRSVLGSVVSQRTNEQKKRALDVVRLAAMASSKYDTFDSMAQSVLRTGMRERLSRNTLDQAIGKLYRTYREYQFNYNTGL